jgi:hypothetical protein
MVGFTVTLALGASSFGGTLERGVECGDWNEPGTLQANE